jgi:hypothetical protein
MNRTYAYLAILILLLVATWFFVLREPASSLDPSDQEFAIQNIDQVHKIHMFDKGGNEVLLTRDRDSWRVNDKYGVMKGNMATLLKTMSRIAVSYPVPLAEEATVIKDLSVNAIKVMAYDENENLMKSYYVGSPTEDHMGTYMILENDGKIAAHPFVVQLRGFKGFLTTRYILDQEKWRDRQLFNIPKEQIKYLTVEYAQLPEQSFRLFVFDGDSMTIAYPSRPEDMNANVSKEHVKAYLGFYEEVFCETFVNEDPRRDSILAGSPFCRISVVPHIGKEESLDLYYMPVGQRSKKKYDDQGREMQYDIDRYFALTQDDDFIVVQDFTFRQLMVLHDDFIPSPEMKTE